MTMDDADRNAIEPLLDEALAETFPASDPIAVTTPTGVYESDLLRFLERAQRLAGEVC
jgi:hypothetical protein